MPILTQNVSTGIGSSQGENHWPATELVESARDGACKVSVDLSGAPGLETHLW